MKPIAIFYHCLFALGEPPEILNNAISVIQEQMSLLKSTGLEDQAEEIHVGINGGVESEYLAEALLPIKSKKVFHGLQCRNECRTIAQMEKWILEKFIPGHEDFYVLYFHAKGSTHPPGDEFRTRWRNCMTRHLIHNWRTCVDDLDRGYDAVGCHWMVPPATPVGQHIFGGNFFWARASFLDTLPSIYDRDRIKVSGIDSFESRYEAEVWIGNGNRIPNVKDYHGPRWDPSKINTCTP